MASQSLRFFLWIPARRSVRDAGVLLYETGLQLSVAGQIAAGRHSLDLDEIKTFAQYLETKKIKAGVLIEVDKREPVDR